MSSKRHPCRDCGRLCNIAGERCRACATLHRGWLRDDHHDAPAPLVQLVYVRPARPTHVCICGRVIAGERVTCSDACARRLATGGYAPNDMRRIPQIA